jgi:hypothetical protein
LAQMMLKFRMRTLAALTNDLDIKV